MPGHPRILLVRTDRLGDVILTLPMLPLLRRAFPSAYLGLLLKRYTGEIVVGNPYADTLLWYDDEAGEIPFGRMLEELRREAFDTVIVVHPTPRLAWLMFRARIPVRVGTGYRWYSLLFNTRTYEHRRDAKRHELDYNINLLSAIGCLPPPGFRPEFPIVIPEAAERRIAAIYEEYTIDPVEQPVVVHPGSGGSAREWPIAHFEELAGRLGPTHRLIVTGDRKEVGLAERVARRGGANCISLAGKLQLMELAALLRRASVFIANSTGPLHLAVALGTPVVGFYPQHAPMSSKRWGPYSGDNRVFVPAKPGDCAECAKGSGVYCSCMASIGVEEVVRAVGELLGDDARRTKRSILHEP